MSGQMRQQLIKQQQGNPANERSKLKDGRERIPMSLPRQKLAVPDIPGFHTHWMRGTPDRIQQAIEGGYEFVNQDEVGQNSFGIADSADNTTGTDLGTRVSVVAGGNAEDGGQPLRMYLMKIRKEWWMEDQEALERRQEQMAQVLRGEQPMSDNPYASQSKYAQNVYGKRENRNILQPKLRTGRSEGE